MDIGKLLALGGLGLIVYLYLNKEAFTLESQATTPATTMPTNGAGLWAGNNIDTLDVNSVGGGGNLVEPQSYAPDLYSGGFDPVASAWAFSDWVNSIPVGGGGEPQGRPLGGRDWVVDVSGYEPLQASYYSDSGISLSF